METQEQSTPAQNFTPEQFAILQHYKDNTWALHDNISDTLLPLISEDIKQIRNLTKDIAVISGAIAAFTIPVLNTNLVQAKFLGYLALILLFTCIVYALHHLSEIIPSELNNLATQHKVYSEVVVEQIKRINQTFEDGNPQHMITSKEELDEKLQDIKNTENKPDKSLDRLKILLAFALLLIFLSFFNYVSIYTWCMNMFSSVFHLVKLNYGFVEDLGLVFDIFGAFALSKGFLSKDRKSVKKEGGSYFNGNPFMLYSLASQVVEVWAGFSYITIGFLFQFLANTNFISQGQLSLWYIPLLLGLIVCLMTYFLIVLPVAKKRARDAVIDMFRKSIQENMTHLIEQKTNIPEDNTATWWGDILKIPKKKNESYNEHAMRINKFVTKK